MRLVPPLLVLESDPARFRLCQGIVEDYDDIFGFSAASCFM